MSRPAPIFLEGIPGQHDPDDVMAMLSENEIQPSAMAKIEGMREWRSVSEALVWSYAKLIDLFRPAAVDLINQVASGQIMPGDVRMAVRKHLHAARYYIPEPVDQITHAIEINGLLLRKYRQVDSEYDEAILGEFPAAELIILGEMDFARDQRSAWQEAGGKIYNERMVARKDDPVWARFSDFGFPFPPFSMDRMIDVADVDFDTAEQWGIVTLDDLPKAPPLKPFSFVGF